MRSSRLALLVAILGYLSYALAFPSTAQYVTALDASDFSDTVEKSDSVWTVLVYEKGDNSCTDLANKFAEAAGFLRGMSKFGSLDASTSSGALKKYGLKAKCGVYTFGWQRDKPVEYKGAKVGKAIAAAVLSEIRDQVSARVNGGKPKPKGGAGAGVPGGAVAELSEASFDKEVYGADDVVMLVFYAPWCGHCKAMMPAWGDAAKKVAGPGSNIRFAKVDCTANERLCGRFGVRGYPTVKYFKAGPKTRGSQGSDYNGGRTLDAFAAFATSEAAKYTPPAEAKPAAAEAKPAAAAGAFAGAGAGEVKQLLGEAELQECVKGQLCMLAFVEEPARAKALAELAAAAKRNSKSPIRWLWAAAGAHPALEAALGVTGAEGSLFPALAAFSTKRSRAAVFRPAEGAGVMAVAAVNEFVDSVLSASVSLVSVTLPTTLAKAPAWVPKTEL